ncbi:MAG: hypothetical protein PXX82_02550 [Methanomassiliicoccales archaeon]|nr:hypothetical protein [Methanomassiliicoccales archaeon]
MIQKASYIEVEENVNDTISRIQTQGMTGKWPIPSGKENRELTDMYHLESENSKKGV